MAKSIQKSRDHCIRTGHCSPDYSRKAKLPYPMRIFFSIQNGWKLDQYSENQENPWQSLHHISTTGSVYTKIVDVHFGTLYQQENSATLTLKNILRCESEIFAWYPTLKVASNTETITEIQNKIETKLENLQYQSSASSVCSREAINCQRIRKVCRAALRTTYPVSGARARNDVYPGEWRCYNVR